MKNYFLAGANVGSHNEQLDAFGISREEIASGHPQDRIMRKTILKKS
jgi:hypothetical protein